MKSQKEIEALLARAIAICQCEYPDNPSAGMDYEAAVRNTLTWVLKQDMPDTEVLDPNYYGE